MSALCSACVGSDQPSPLVELSSMHFWFDDFHIFIYSIVFDFVRAWMYVIIIIENNKRVAKILIYLLCIWMKPQSWKFSSL